MHIKFNEKYYFQNFYNFIEHVYRFINFSQDLLERSMGMTSFYGEAPWEAKVIAVIGCIKDPKVMKNNHFEINFVLKTRHLLASYKK